MLRQIELVGDRTIEQCRSDLRGIEARRGRVVDIVAEDPTDTADATLDGPGAAGDADTGSDTAVDAEVEADGDEQDERITVVSATREPVAANSLHLVAEGDEPPAGKNLESAGTAWVDGEKKVVKIYR